VGEGKYGGWAEGLINECVVGGQRGGWRGISQVSFES